MGYSVSAANAGRVFHSLAFHPNFALGETPSRSEDVEAYVIESVACFVSPPKIEGENEQFESKELADAVKYNLARLLRHRLQTVPKAQPILEDTVGKVWSFLYQPPHSKGNEFSCEDLARSIRNMVLR